MLFSGLMVQGLHRFMARNLLKRSGQMIKLGIPVIDQHEITYQCLKYLDQNSTIPGSLKIVIIDNGSDLPYSDYIARDNKSWTFNFEFEVLRNQENKGFYWPMLQVAEDTTSADIIGLMHNDLFIYEPGFDRRLMDAFVQDHGLGMVGVCGSNEVDDRGGRGGGTMCNFAGRVGQLQEHTGKRVKGIHFVLLLDSMFIALRRSTLSYLKIDDQIAPCHFYDKIWPLRMVENNWRVAVLGLEVDHQGGLTSAGGRFERDCETWCQRVGLSYEPGKAGLAVYLEAERRFLDEYRLKGFIPSRIP